MLVYFIQKQNLLFFVSNALQLPWGYIKLKENEINTLKLLFGFMELQQKKNIAYFNFEVQRHF